MSARFAGSMQARDRALFFLGINTGFRISELLAIRLGWILTYPGELKPLLTIPKEYRKGGKRAHSVKLTPNYMQNLRPWIDQLQELGYIHEDCYLFSGTNGKPISRVYYWRLFKAAAARAGIHPNSLGIIGTHTMRKTFIGGINEQNKLKHGEDAPLMTQKIIGHAKLESTIAYLPSRQEDLDDTVTDYIATIYRESG